MNEEGARPTSQERGENAVRERTGRAGAADVPADSGVGGATAEVATSLTINGVRSDLSCDPRVTLLDALRERLGLTGTKKGCDHGQCGVCTVIIDGRRELSCLTLLATCDGRLVTTIEGVAPDEELHPLQEAFIRHDALQCGFCTSGQICSMLALMDEAENGDVSFVTPDVREMTSPLPLSDGEIKERLSGNICRCGAYLHLLAAYQDAQGVRQSDGAADPTVIAPR